MLLSVLIIFAICLLLGAVVGFFAGLLGIGGGVIIVPVLSSVLQHYAGLDPKPAFIVAVSTSLASIIFTSFASAKSHHRHGNIDWSVAGWSVVGVSVGAAVASVFAGQISTEVLELIFAVSVSFVALRLGFSRRRVDFAPGVALNFYVLLPTVMLLGSISTLIGIGGGALIVPLLSQMKYSLKKSIGIGAVCGVFISITATFGYIIAGWHHYRFSDGYIGYIYLPALAGIISTSWYFAAIGADKAQVLPIIVIKRILAIFLFLAVLRMVLV